MSWDCPVCWYKHPLFLHPTIRVLLLKWNPSPYKCSMQQYPNHSCLEPSIRMFPVSQSLIISCFCTNNPAEKNAREKDKFMSHPFYLLKEPEKWFGGTQRGNPQKGLMTSPLTVTLLQSITLTGRFRASQLNLLATSCTAEGIHTQSAAEMVLTQGITACMHQGLQSSFPWDHRPWHRAVNENSQMYPVLRVARTSLRSQIIKSQNGWDWKEP